jgi:hypothetical protein
MAIAVDKLMRQLGSIDVQTKYLEPLKNISKELTRTLKTSLQPLTVPHVYEKPVEIPILKLDSKVLPNPSSLNFVMREIEAKERNIKILDPRLLFRGSKYGFRAKEFHSSCDYEANLLVLVKSTKNKIFGGYTGSAPYPAIRRQFIESSNSFLFSVDYQEIYSRMEKGGIKNHSDCGPEFGVDGFFGGSLALSLSDECHQNNKSVINSGSGYSFSERRRLEEVVGEAGGSTKFTVAEYEVWEMIIKVFLFSFLHH